MRPDPATAARRILDESLASAPGRQAAMPTAVTLLPQSRSSSRSLSTPPREAPVQD